MVGNNLGGFGSEVSKAGPIVNIDNIDFSGVADDRIAAIDLKAELFYKRFDSCPRGAKSHGAHFKIILAVEAKKRRAHHAVKFYDLSSHVLLNGRLANVAALEFNERSVILLPELTWTTSPRWWHGRLPVLPSVRLAA